jgi:hypothetical protein
MKAVLVGLALIGMAAAVEDDEYIVKVTVSGMS